MVVYKYGDPEANIVLIQPVGDHDVHDIENEVSEIKKRTSLEFQMVAVKVDSWNQDLSPWRAPAVFGNENFGEGASALLAQILELCKDESKTYYLGGYSLAGLAIPYSFTYERNPGNQTDGDTAAIPANLSVWQDVQSANSPAREERKNQVMAAVGDCIRELYGWLQEQEIDSILEWNQGNHFKEPGIRTAKAFAWMMERTKGTIRGR